MQTKLEEFIKASPLTVVVGKCWSRDGMAVLQGVKQAAGHLATQGIQQCKS